MLYYEACLIKTPRAERLNCISVRHHDDEAELSDTNSEKQNYRRKSDKNENAKKESSETVLSLI